MVDISVELHLGNGCCIECAAKRAYNKMVLDIMTMEDAPGPDVETRLDLLLDFLKFADFGALRSSDERLAGTMAGRCILRKHDDRTPFVTICDS